MAERSHHAPQIILGSAENLSALADDSVTLTVTSPPYWNAVDYDIHAADGNRRWYRTRNYAEGFKGYEDYLKWLRAIFEGVLRKTRPGGYCAVVLGTVLLKGKHYPVPFDLVHAMVENGWEFHEDIIWHKVTGGVKRAGVFIQKPYPGYYYPNIMTEYIMVLRKPGPPLYAEVDEAQKEQARLAINDLFKLDYAHNIWHIAPVPPGHLEHPCPFPEEIPFRLILLYSYPDDLVLDPFLGSGQTTKVAHHLGRRSVAYDTKNAYVEYARKRSSEPLAIRRQQLVARFEKIEVPLAAYFGIESGMPTAKTKEVQATLFKGKVSR